MAFLYKADPKRADVWLAAFTRAAPDIEFRSWPDMGDPSEVRFLASWLPPDDVTSMFPNLEVLFCTGAGVDQLHLDRLPERVQVVRMIEPALVATMAEFVGLAVTALHRDMPLYLQQQRQRTWHEHRVRAAGASRVGVMGLGVLGSAALARLRLLGFDCAAWNRSHRDVDGMPCFVGPAGLGAFLARTEILVCLLPLTQATRGILDARLFAALPVDAAVVNVGRGGHVVEPDLLAALDRGHLRAAVLDVCETEPVPAAHPFWAHPKIWLTPHIASTTQPGSAVEAVLANLRRHRRHEPMQGLVDRRRGY